MGTVSTDESAVLSVHDVYAQTGVSVDRLRAKLRADAGFRALFTRIGRCWALPSGRLPAVRALLANGGTS